MEDKKKMSIEDNDSKKLEQQKPEQQKTDKPKTGKEALDIVKAQKEGKDVTQKLETSAEKPKTGKEALDIVKQERNLESARIGQKAHAEYFSELKQNPEMGGGWEIFKVEKVDENGKIKEVPAIDTTVGGTKRPDVVYINHEQKRIVVEDLYTGNKKDVQTASGYESRSHNQKGWDYSQEPKIQEKIQEGYTFEYVVAPWNPKKDLSELN